TIHPMSDVAPLDGRARAIRFLTLWQRNLQAWAAEEMAPFPLAPPGPEAGPATPLPMPAEALAGFRPGPRPLPAHLALMSMATVAGAAALPLMPAGSPLWHPSLA